MEPVIADENEQAVSADERGSGAEGEKADNGVDSAASSTAVPSRDPSAVPREEEEEPEDEEDEADDDGVFLDEAEVSEQGVVADEDGEQGEDVEQVSLRGVSY